MADLEDINNLLAAIRGRSRVLLCQYEGPTLKSSIDFRNNTLSTDHAVWELSTSTIPLDADPEILEVQYILTLKEGYAQSQGMAISFDFDDWKTDNYVLLPASVYNGNRCKIVDREYAAGLDRKWLYQKDIPEMSVPIPHLTVGEKALSRLEVNASNLSTPAICFLDQDRKQGFIVLSEQKGKFGENGFSVEESPDRSFASLIISVPGVRERQPLFVGFAESHDRGADMKPGDSLSLKIQIKLFDSEDIPSFLDTYMTVRKSLTGLNHPRNLIPFIQVTKWMTQRIDERWYEDSELSHYCPENANWISFGWVGGLINTYPILALQDSLHTNRALQTFDFAIPRAQGVSGYFYGATNEKGENFSRDGYPEFPELVLTRKVGDVLYWMIKQFNLLKATGRSQLIHPVWEDNIGSVADALVLTWGKCGQWGKTLNNKTGEVAEYGTTGGVMAIAGLALASTYYHNPQYLAIAKEAADYYYDQFAKLGYTNGGCADILHNADSETAAGFMTALMTLYEATQEPEWLSKCKDLAHLCATWTTSYDYELPKETELGRLGAKLAGIYWASTQNKHGAPGICTNSGDALFKIYRHTRERKYADLLNDIVHAHGESIRPGGYTNERLTYCDAESRGERGTHVTGWNETNGFLMALEIPGLYVNTDTKEYFVFDHVEIKKFEVNQSGIEIEIYNPTNYNAELTVFAESAHEASVPLGDNAFIKWPKVKVASKGKVKFYLSDLVKD